MVRYLILAQQTNLNLDYFKFRPEASNFANQVFIFGSLAVLVLLAGAIVFFYLRNRRRLLELSQEREEARLRLMASELNLGRSEVELLQLILGSNNPGDLLPALESRSAFEEAVQRFREANPEHAALRRTPQLRQRLNYGFANIRNPFVDTRMLPPGTRMRCSIHTPRREVHFLTTLLGSNESQFIIRPPTAKGKPVALPPLPRLDFRVSREHDAEYEFSAPVVRQLQNATRAILLGHTRDISRMLFRNAERVDAEIPTQIYVIRHEFAGERSAAHMKLADSQYRFPGAIHDLSIGGALVIAEGRQERLHDGDLVLFRLPDAQIKDDLVCQVMGAFVRDDGNTQIHLQFVGMKELNRLKLGKYLASLKENAPPPHPGDGQNRPQVS